MTEFNLHYNKPLIEADDEQAVLNALRSDSLSQGAFQQKFESSLAERYCVGHATAFSSATAALHATLHSVGICEGDLVWTTPLTFVATANSARYCGGRIDFVDIDAATFNISVPLLEEKLLEANRSNILPKALISVDFAGVPVDLKEIHELCSRFGVIHVEDASQAQGASYESMDIGGCKYSDAVVFSFHPVKTMTTGEGGAVLTNNGDLDRQLKLFRSAGIQKSQFEAAAEQPWRAEMVTEGYNYKMNELEAALGVSQLSKVDRFIARREQIYSQYRAKLKGEFLCFQKILENRTSAHHLFPILIDFEALGVQKRDYFMWMKERGVTLYSHYLPLHQHEFYSTICPSGALQHADRYYQQSFSYPLHTCLKDHEIDHVCNLIEEFFE